MTVDVIIPSYKPGKKFIQLIESLERQTRPVNKIIVMNTEEKYFDMLVSQGRFLELHPRLEVRHLSIREFDHGKTRNRGVKRSQADIFVCMTQDAVPADEHLVEELTDSLMQADNIAVAYARQLPDENCGIIENYTRKFNYPEESRIKGKEDIPKLGIKTYFCSNVCAAYRRDVFDTLGGFVNKTVFNEDMIYAAKAVQAGYKIAYAAKARVIHSHNYTAAQQFHRNFDLGVSHAQYPDVFSGVPAESEGIKLVKDTVKYLAKKKPGLIFRLFTQSAAKYAGYLMGKKYKKLPDWLVKKCSTSAYFWER